MSAHVLTVICVSSGLYHIDKLTPTTDLTWRLIAQATRPVTQAVRDPYHVATRRARMFSAADPRSAGCNRTGLSCTRQIAVTPIAPQTARVTCFAAGARQLCYCRQKSELRPGRADNYDRANVKVSSVRALAGGAHGIVDSQLPYGLAAKAEYGWGGAVGPGSRS